MPFEVRVMDGIDESYPEDLPVSKVALYIAGKKADAYREKMADDELIITADTVVIVDDEILGKPHDKDDAIRMLKLISGRTHQVTTGVCLLSKKQESRFSTKRKKAMSADMLRSTFARTRRLNSACFAEPSN